MDKHQHATVGDPYLLPVHTRSTVESDEGKLTKRLGKYCRKCSYAPGLVY